MVSNNKRPHGSISNQHVFKLHELLIRYCKEFEVQNPKEDIDITTFLDSATKWHLPLKRVKQNLLVSCAEQALQKYLTANSTEVNENGTPTISLIDSDDDKPQEASSIATTPTSTVNNSLNQNMMKLWKVGNKQNNPNEKEESATGNPAKKAKKSSSYQTAPSYTLEDLGGMDAILEEVLELVVMPIRHPEIYLHTGIDPPRGILLHGPPGCGKTMLANALAGELGVPFLPISAPSVVSGMSGESEKKIREVFEEAKNSAPCILFIDEIDAITPKRETAQREMERRMVAQLLTCLDDLSWDKTNYQPVIVLGATNRPDAIDPALRRAGRFDREIQLPIPDELSRERILKVMSNKLKLSGDLNLTQLAKLTPGYVGADLKALVCAAGMIAVKRIFSTLVHQASSTPTLEDPADDPAPLTIQRFLNVHSQPLTDDELEPLAINLEDFLEAVKKVQPSSKREGFATVPGVSWSDIGALSTIRQELRMAIVEPIRHRELFTQVGISASCGVLLWGPPGCGKTLLAKAVANEAHSNFISVKGPELLNKYVGESERSIRQVFDRARASSPCVVFFDEMDALCGRRDESQSEVSARVVNTLLTELDGLESRKQVFIIAATNRPDMIDPAILRPGRLDKLLYVELPTPDERGDILKTLTKKTPMAEDVDLKLVAHDDRANGFSGADLASLVRESSVTALKSALYRGPSANQSDGELQADLALENKVMVTMDHFSTALSKVSPSVTKQDMKMFENLKVKFGWKY